MKFFISLNFPENFFEMVPNLCHMPIYVHMFLFLFQTSSRSTLNSSGIGRHIQITVHKLPFKAMYQGGIKKPFLINFLDTSQHKTNCGRQVYHVKVEENKRQCKIANKFFPVSEGVGQFFFLPLNYDRSSQL